LIYLTSERHPIGSLRFSLLASFTRRNDSPNGMAEPVGNSVFDLAIKTLTAQGVREAEVNVSSPAATRLSH